jgi:hypothetical protein
MALCSRAKALMVVKIVVPTLGSFEEICISLKIKKAKIEECLNKKTETIKQYERIDSKNFQRPQNC